MRRSRAGGGEAEVEAKQTEASRLQICNIRVALGNTYCWDTVNIPEYERRFDCTNPRRSQNVLVKYFDSWRARH